MGTERREDQVRVGVVEGGRHGGTRQVVHLGSRAHQVVEAGRVGGHGAFVQEARQSGRLACGS
jgi:hypothetical protein